MNKQVMSGNEPRILKGWQSLAIAAVALCGLTAIAATMLMQGVARGHEISYSEIRAASRLRSICMGQLVFVGETVVDQDRDGKGEFGWLAEITAARPPRGSTTALQSAVVDRSLGETGPHAGVVVHEGYCFVLYLPDGKGGWERETAASPPSDPAMADAQEQDFRAYAWPEERGRTGWRSFAIDASGVLRATSLEDQKTYSSPLEIPHAAAAFTPESRWSQED
jgi:hypothetical protein